MKVPFSISIDIYIHDQQVRDNGTSVVGKVFRYHLKLKSQQRLILCLFTEKQLQILIERLVFSNLKMKMSGLPNMYLSNQFDQHRYGDSCSYFICRRDTQIIHAQGEQNVKQKHVRVTPIKTFQYSINKQLRMKEVVSTQAIFVIGNFSSYTFFQMSQDNQVFMIAAHV